MGKIERRAHIAKQTPQHFIDYVESRMKKDGVEGDYFPKKIMLDYSYVCNNIIPAWARECMSPKRGYLSLAQMKENCRLATEALEQRAARKAAMQELRVNAKAARQEEAARVKQEREAQKAAKKEAVKQKAAKKVKAAPAKPVKQKAVKQKPTKPPKVKTPNLGTEPELVQEAKCSCGSPVELFQSVDASGDIVTEGLCKACGKKINMKTTSASAGLELAAIELADTDD
jgi:ATPase subunit of ABC transporter with duplicated ATPase domains